MAEIRPFKGVHYSSSSVKDLSQAICPPHDIISPQKQEELYQADEHNFIRLEYGRETPADTAADNRYTRAAATLEQWLKKGVLETDRAPAIYLHDHFFILDGAEYKRRGIIVRVRLEEWDKMIIRPHENTFAVTRGDRLSLLRALQANTSPILAMFEDKQQKIYAQLARHSQRLPLIASRIVNGEGHKVWAITDSGAIDEIARGLAEQPLYIADGHHRYESALTYRNERRAAGKAKDDAPFNYVMMELVDFSQQGLKILAAHRLVKGIAQNVLDGLETGLSEFFTSERLSVSADLKKQLDSLFADDGVRAVLYGPAKGSLTALKLKTPAAVTGLIPGDHPDVYKNLDVSIADHIILERVLRMAAGAEKNGLAFSHDVADAAGMVQSGEYQLAVLLRPIRPETLKAVSDAGDKMPPKSTYFYPKVPSGLIFNRLM